MFRRLSAVAAVSLAVATLPSVVAGADARAQQKPKFTGDPITVMTIGEFDVSAVGSANPELPGAVKARAKTINKNGGIEDASGETHQVKVIACNTNLDPNRSEQCARDAADTGAVAVLANSSVAGAQILPILEQNGIASIGQVVFQPVDATSPVTFPLTSGIAGIFAGLPQSLTLDGVNRISYIISDIGATTAAAVLFLDQGLALTDAEKGAEVRVPQDAGDLAPYIATGTDGVDGVVGFLLGDQEATLLQQMQASGYDGKISTQAGLLTQDLLDKAGDAADGMLTTGIVTPFTNTKVKGVRMYRKDMKAYDSSLEMNDSSLNSWASMWVFERVASGLPTIDRASVLDAMGKVEGLDMGGITPPLTTTAPSGIPLLDRVYNPTVVFGEVKDGKIVQTDDRFFNPFTGEFVSS
jgi:ABC-type branched-subunit amino acid transport system substrate-binding protein